MNLNLIIGSIVLFVLQFTTISVSSQNNVHERKIDLYAKVFKDSLQGKPFIDFESSLLTGETVTLSKYKGKIILLNFWFVGCAPCMGEISDLNKVYNSYKDSNVVMLSLARNSELQLKKFIEGKYSRPMEKIQYPIIPKCDEIAGKYNVSGYPTTIFIDKKGTIRLSHGGASIQSLKKYVAFYGDKKLSKAWKKILKDNSGGIQPDMSEIFSQLLDELLRE